MPWYAVVEWKWLHGYTSGVIETPFRTEAEAQAAADAEKYAGYPKDGIMTVTTFVAVDYQAAKHEAIRQGRDYRLRPVNHLTGAMLQWKKYDKSYHDHCVFCWRRFLNRDDPENKPEWFEDPNDRVADAGYVTLATEGQRADAHWICEECFNDLTPTFQWRIVHREVT